MKRFMKSVLVLGVLTLVGCATTPYLDDHMGDATKAASKLQTANPKAPAANAAIQMDGQNAASAVDRYNKAGREPPQNVNVFNIGVGSN